MVITDFVNYWLAHPEVIFDQKALTALTIEQFSTTVLTSPVPGDLWS